MCDCQVRDEAGLLRLRWPLAPTIRIMPPMDVAELSFLPPGVDASGDASGDAAAEAAAEAAADHIGDHIGNSDGGTNGEDGGNGGNGGDGLDGVDGVGGGVGGGGGGGEGAVCLPPLLAESDCYSLEAFMSRATALGAAPQVLRIPTGDEEGEEAAAMEQDFGVRRERDSTERT